MVRLVANGLLTCSKFPSSRRAWRTSLGRRIFADKVLLLLALELWWESTASNFPASRRRVVESLRRLLLLTAIDGDRQRVTTGLCSWALCRETSYHSKLSHPGAKAPDAQRNIKHHTLHYLPQLLASMKFQIIHLHESIYPGCVEQVQLWENADDGLKFCQESP